MDFQVDDTLYGKNALKELLELTLPSQFVKIILMI
jgi:hypothetical protein